MDPSSKLYDLISQKEFSDLNEVEKAFVLEHYCESEFQGLRKAELASRGLQEQERPMPDSLIKTNLMRAFQEKKTKTKSINLWSYPIPLYQVAASVAIMAFGFIFLGKRASDEPKIVYQERIKTDTIYQVVEKLVTVVPKSIHTTLQNKSTYLEKLSDVQHDTLTTRDEIYGQNIFLSMAHSVSITPYKEDQGNGHSLRDDSALAQFAVSADGMR